MKIGELVERLESAYETLSKCESAINELRAERDAYLAELQKANAVIIDLQRNPPKYATSHLAEIRAEAGRAGFVEGYEAGHTYRFANIGDQLADEYADSIRRSGAS